MVAAASSLTGGNICIWFLVIGVKSMDNNNEDNDDDCKHEENVDILEELTTLLLVTWVVLAGIVNGQPHQDQGDQDHRKLYVIMSKTIEPFYHPKVIKTIMSMITKNSPNPYQHHKSLQ